MAQPATYGDEVPPVADPQPFSYPMISQEQLQLDNLLAGSNTLVALPLGEGRIGLQLGPWSGEPPDCPVLAIELGVGRLFALLDEGLLETLCAPWLGGAPFAELPEELQLAALTATFAPLSDHLEKAFGLRFTPIGLSREAPPPGVSATLFRLAEEGRLASGTLVLHPSTLERLLPQLERLPPQAPRRLDGISIRLSLQLRGPALTAAELRELEPHDLLLLEGASDAPLPLLIVLGGRPLFSGLLQGARVQIQELLVPTMNDPNPSPEQTPPPALSPDEIEIGLTFEVGRKEITIGELSQLQPGHTFELATPAQRPVTIRANGRAIGHGELVQIADRLGVRILDLFQPDE